MSADMREHLFPEISSWNCTGSLKQGGYLSSISLATFSFSRDNRLGKSQRDDPTLQESLKNKQRPLGFSWFKKKLLIIPISTKSLLFCF